jgi:hypothetical protein
MVLDHFQHAGASEVLQRFGIYVLPPALGLPECKAERSPYLDREAFEILPAGSHPEERLGFFT